MDCITYFLVDFARRLIRQRRICVAEGRRPFLVRERRSRRAAAARAVSIRARQSSSPESSGSARFVPSNPTALAAPRKLARGASLGNLLVRRQVSHARQRRILSRGLTTTKCLCGLRHQKLGRHRFPGDGVSRRQDAWGKDPSRKALARGGASVRRFGVGGCWDNIELTRRPPAMSAQVLTPSAKLYTCIPCDE